MNSLEFLTACKSEIIELQRTLTSIPAIAPEGGGDGEAKKAAALEEWLKRRFSGKCGSSAFFCGNNTSKK